MYHEAIGVDGSRPAILLVHGMLASRRLWDQNRAALSAQCGLVLVDLPGHGKSPPLDQAGAPRVADVIAGFERIRAELGLDRWYICGQSFGGGLTLRYSFDHPDRVAGHAFTNSRTTFRDTTLPDEIAIRKARVERIRAEGRDAMRREVFYPSHARRFPPEVRETLVEEAEKIDIESYLGFVDVMSPELSLHGRAARPRVPTLLINGRHERAFQATRQEIAEAWPDIEIADIDGGHAVNIENPQGFAATLLDFVKRTEAAQSPA